MSNPLELTTATQGDKTFQATRRTHAHLQWTIARLARLHPGAHLHVIQPSYNTDVDASAGTHDKDGVLDVAIYGLDWYAAQAFLRAAGWAAWVRTPAQGFGWHIHMVSLGLPDSMVGVLVPAQVADYYNHAFGLRGMHTPGSDHTWFPEHIGETVFDFARWEREMEDQMGYNDWEPADREALRDDIRAIVREALAQIPAGTAEQVWAYPVRTTPILLARAALRKSAEED